MYRMYDITRNFNCRKLKPFVFSKWSTNLPGVAMMIWGFFSNSNPCACMSIPPTTTIHFTPMQEPETNMWYRDQIVLNRQNKFLPSASNCSEIWKANSLVGVSTSAKYLWGFSNNACSIGNAKAAVFPDPVSANPITSLPMNYQNKYRYVNINNCFLEFNCNYIIVKITLKYQRNCFSLNACRFFPF